MYGYDEYMVHVLDFEFLSVDCMYFEEKENQATGNRTYFYEGFEYKEKKNSVFEKTQPEKMEIGDGLWWFLHHGLRYDV